jgi:hypothetical protein
MNIQSMVIIAIILFTFYLFIKDYKRTRNLAEILDKINFANKQYFFDVHIKKTNKYKRIKVSKEAFNHYSIGEFILK